PETTLPYSPHQNGKQESFWGPLEGRLMKMLKGVPLTLQLLNEATQAWVELDHNQKSHSELGNQTPIERFLQGPDVGRPSPDSQALSDRFRWQVKRQQRRSDGTLSALGVRYEIPARYRHMQPVWIRIAQWDKSHVLLVDHKTDQVLCVLHPLDKEKNASGMRRKLTSPEDVFFFRSFRSCGLEFPLPIPTQLLSAAAQQVSSSFTRKVSSEVADRLKR
ncbi:integrase core domain-containing protein, partial [Myxococcota bacterium]|nr:integrase core domain-containing protein [Myxococcota bacterium]